MKKQYVLALLISMCITIISAQEADMATSSPNPLIGEWTIDLRPTPESEGYYQKFVVTAIEGNTFTGTFYGSPIENGLINQNWDKLYVAFTTSDASNDYYHSGYLENGSLKGISYCPNRAFTAPWTGVKQ
ncbi:hypothetical protein [uncultured Muriicola sp.]|uniref:hypothetical protein n=1 Tax=uncultured Muriicola sp. TaxID=1583102 RepID=UPI002611C4E7|nr:hypothetical protein [uncultured Muriicola sp.]